MPREPEDSKFVYTPTVASDILSVARDKRLARALAVLEGWSPDALDAPQLQRELWAALGRIVRKWHDKVPSDIEIALLNRALSSWPHEVRCFQPPSEVLELGKRYKAYLPLCRALLLQEPEYWSLPMLEDLAFNPALQAITCLEFSGFPDPGVLLLLSSEQLLKLRDLRIEGMIPPVFWRRASDSPCLPRVTSLCWSDSFHPSSPLGAREWSIEESFKVCKLLQRLELQGQPLSASLLRAMGGLSELRHLRLSRVDASKVDSSALLQSLPQTLESLELDRCAKIGAHLAQLCEADPFSGLSSLSLSLLSGLTSDTWERMARSPRIAGLKQLKLSCLSGEGWQEFLAQAPLVCLEELHIQNMGLSEACCDRLAANPHLGSLRSLRLEQNGLVRPPWIPADGLPSLETLELCKQELEDEGFSEWCRGLRAPRLRHLSLRDNPLSAQGLEALAMWKGLPQLQILDLRGILGVSKDSLGLHRGVTLLR